MPTRCTATKNDGTPCKAWAMRGTEPPRCAAHAGHGVGAPPQNQNARKHGAYAAPSTGPTASLSPVERLRCLADDMTRRREDVLAYLSAHADDLNHHEYANLVELAARTGSRIARIEKTVAGMTDTETDLSHVIEATLAELEAQTHNRAYLLALLCERFNEAELRELCFYMQLDYDSLAGHDQSFTAHARALIEYHERHNTLPALLHTLRTRRPDIDLTALGDCDE